MRGQQGPGSPDPSGYGAPEAEPLLDVVLRIYQSTVRADAWQSIMNAVAPLMGTGKALFIRADRTHPSDSITEVMGLAPQFVTALKNRDLNQDKIWHALLAVPAGRVLKTTDLLPRSALQSGSIYEDIGRPAGLEFSIGAILENGPEFFSNLCYMRADIDFDEGHERVLKTLLPHLQMAATLGQRIATGEAGRREALLSFDRARQPVVILNRSGYAIYSNEYASRVLKNANGLDLKFGRFLFDNMTAQAEFERAVRIAVASVDRDVQAVPHEIRVARRRAGSPYALFVIPLLGTSDRALLPDGAACLILIHDLERVIELPLQRLAWLYSLTPAEVRICESLYRVGLVESAARDLSLTRNTVRSHLKTIYAKFGVSTQGQLMRRLANSIALTGGVNWERLGTQ